jgi:hypothetical protein
VVEHRHTRAVFVVADCGVDQDDPPGTADDPTLIGDDHVVAVGFPKLRREPVLVCLPQSSIGFGEDESLWERGCEFGHSSDFDILRT